MGLKKLSSSEERVKGNKYWFEYVPAFPYIYIYPAGTDDWQRALWMISAGKDKRRYRAAYSHFFMEKLSILDANPKQVDAMIEDAVKRNLLLSKKEWDKLDKKSKTGVPNTKSFDKVYEEKRNIAEAWGDNMTPKAKVGEVVWSAPSNDGNKFVVSKRDKPAAPSHVKDKAKWDRGQDNFMMFVLDKSGKVVKNWGSHSSLDGAKKFAKNRGIISEAKSATGYEIYHKDYSSAVQHARKEAEKKGYQIDDDDWDRKVAMGPRKPGNGKTNSFNIGLLDRAGKPVKKTLNMQVYNTGNKYELNMYVEEVQIDELSKETLKSYKDKADRSYDSHLEKSADKYGKGLEKWRSSSSRADYIKQAAKHGKTADKRAKYLNKVDKKLSEEQIDEILPVAPVAAVAARAAGAAIARRGAGKVSQWAARKTASAAIHKAMKKESLKEAEGDYVWIIKGSGRDKNAPQKKVPKSALDKYTKSGWKIHENQMMRMDEVQAKEALLPPINKDSLMGKMTPPKDDAERRKRAQAYRDKKAKEVNEISTGKLQRYLGKAKGDVHHNKSMKTMLKKGSSFDKEADATINRRERGMKLASKKLAGRKDLED